MRKCEKIIKIQKELNNKLARVFKEYGITRFTLTSLGNSIASGYSVVRTVKPMLLRNESLEKIMTDNDILLDIHHFARSQSNNEDRINEWLITNIRESQIHEMNRSDYGNNKTSQVTHGLDESKIDKYYSLQMDNDIGLKDKILESDNNLANIIIYNGCTGSFLDSITRGGKLFNKLTFGVNKDVIGLESILKYIETSNRYNNSNTQVYICGVPNFLGLNISEIINSKLKRLANIYSNVTYVQPVKSKFFYKSVIDENIKDISTFQTIISNILLSPDIHYDEIEYLKFNNNIIECIVNNYSVNKAMINIDRQLLHFSNNLELKNHELIDNNDVIKDVITKIILSEYYKINEPEKKKRFIDRAYKYLLDKVPYDFYLLKKENIKCSFKTIK